MQLYSVCILTKLAPASRAFAKCSYDVAGKPCCHRPQNGVLENLARFLLIWRFPHESMFRIWKLGRLQTVAPRGLPKLSIFLENLDGLMRVGSPCRRFSVCFTIRIIMKEKANVKKNLRPLPCPPLLPPHDGACARLPASPLRSVFPPIPACPFRSTGSNSPAPLRA